MHELLDECIGYIMCWTCANTTLVENSKSKQWRWVYCKDLEFAMEKTMNFILDATLLFRQHSSLQRRWGCHRFLQLIQLTHLKRKTTTWLRHLQVSVAQKCFFHSTGHQTLSFLPSQTVWTWHFTLCPGIFMGIPRAKLRHFCFCPKTSGAQNVEDAVLTQDSLFHKLATEIVTHENWNT